MNIKDLIFLDVEATGLEEKDRLFQVAYDYQNQEKVELFKPETPITCEAMEVTGYTNKDVENKEKFQKSEFWKELKKIIDEGGILVAHNAKFDIEMLRRDGIEVKNFIDTYKIAQYLDQKGFFKSYRLQYLRYCLDLEVENARAHDALGDIRVLKALFFRLYEKFLEKYSDEEEALKEMIKISKEPILIKKFNFGKYQGEFVHIVAQTDRGYLEWLYQQKIQQAQEGEEDEDWIFTLKKYLD